MRPLVGGRWHRRHGLDSVQETYYENPILSRWKRGAFSQIAVFFCSNGLSLGTARHADEPATVAHYIDVGQGACNLLELPCGDILVDTARPM
jgi:hypothetical protein